MQQQGRQNNRDKVGTAHRYLSASSHRATWRRRQLFHNLGIFPIGGSDALGTSTEKQPANLSEDTLTIQMSLSLLELITQTARLLAQSIYLIRLAVFLHDPF